jgi:hypothetical protein
MTRAILILSFNSLLKSLPLPLVILVTARMAHMGRTAHLFDCQDPSFRLPEPSFRSGRSGSTPVFHLQPGLAVELRVDEGYELAVDGLSRQAARAAGSARPRRSSCRRADTSDTATRHAGPSAVLSRSAGSRCTRSGVRLAARPDPRSTLTPAGLCSCSPSYLDGPRESESEQRMRRTGRIERKSQPAHDSALPDAGAGA